LKDKIAGFTLKLDEDFTRLLLQDERIKKCFFKDVSGIMIFDKEKFMKFVNGKEFFPDFYIRLKTKLGLLMRNFEETVKYLKAGKPTLYKIVREGKFLVASLKIKTGANHEYHR